MQIPTNKLVLFPLTFMLIATFVAFVWTGDVYNAPTDTYGNGTVVVDGEPSTFDTGSHRITVNIWALTGVMLGGMTLLVTAVGLGILSGLNILGSGFGEKAQSLVFASIIWLGLWAVLSLAALSLFASDDTGLCFILWGVLSFAYSIGLGSEMGG